jgi:hypothetical protein
MTDNPSLYGLRQAADAIVDEYPDTGKIVYAAADAWHKREKRLLEVEQAVKEAEQTLRNLASGDLRGDAQTIAFNAADALRRLVEGDMLTPETLRQEVMEWIEHGATLGTQKRIYAHADVWEAGIGIIQALDEARKIEHATIDSLRQRLGEAERLLALGYGIAGGGTPGHWWLRWMQGVKSFLPRSVFDKGGPIWDAAGNSRVWHDTDATFAALKEPKP